MKSVLIKWCFLASSFLFAVCRIPAQDMTAQLDKLFKEVSADPQMHFNGVVLIADQDHILYQNAQGYSDIHELKLNSSNTRFQLASLSKVFTAVAIMQLVEKGNLKLEDNYIKYFPSFPFPDITIRQLLSHTSGLPDFREVYEKRTDHPLNNTDLIPDLIKFGHLLFTPGTQWSYSSMGYGLLANLVEKISGNPFPFYINDFICKPAGLLHTYVLTVNMKHPDSLRSISYISSDPGLLTAGDSIPPDTYNPWQTIMGPGLMVSSAEDLLLFSEALYNNKILSAASQELMYEPVKLSDGNLAALAHAPIYAGLGWGIDMDHSSGTVVSHNGGSPGISTILLRNLQTHQTVIVLENTNNMAPISFGVNSINILSHKPVRHFGPPPGHVN